MKAVVNPTKVEVSGIKDEPGLNGTYLKTTDFRGRAQWMKPNSRCYIRFIRERWEIYVSHHPEGTTYYFHEDQNESLPGDGDSWTPTENATPGVSLKFGFEEILPEVSQSNEFAAKGGRKEAKLVLYMNETCPYVQTVRLAIVEKQLNAVYMQEDVIGDKSERLISAYKRVNPDGKRRAAIPILEHHATKTDTPVTLIESRVIVDYLEDSFPEAPRLVPQVGPAAKAYMKLFIDLCDRNLSGCTALFLSSRTPGRLHEANAVFKHALEAVECGLKMFASKAGPFFFGESFGLVEVLLAPMLQRLLRLPPHFRPCLAKMQPWRSMDASFPKFCSWTKSVLNHPSARATFKFDEVVSVKEHVVASYAPGDETEDLVPATMSSRVDKLSSLFAASKAHVERPQPPQPRVGVEDGAGDK